MKFTQKAENYYTLIKDDVEYGSFKIEYLINDIKLDIFVNEEHRGNGYGKLIFNSAINYLKEKGYSKINAKLKHSDYIMNRIITNYGAHKVYRNENEIQFIIPIK